MAMRLTEEEFQSLMMRTKSPKICGMKIQKVRIAQTEEEVAEAKKAAKKAAPMDRMEMNLAESLLYVTAKTVVMASKILLLVAIVLVGVAKMAIEIGKGK
jgi:hypothetical protein